jgi:hypothetical protein
MLKTEDAYKVLGLNENASRDQIESSFTMLMKKHRLSGSAEQGEEAEKIDIDKITMAYNLLMGYVEEVSDDEKTRKPSPFFRNPLFKKMGIDAKKAENFWHYHKIHFFAGVIVIVILVSLLKSCIFRVEPDLNIALVGNLFNITTEKLGDIIKEGLDDINEVSIDQAILTDRMDGEQEYAMAMKATVLFAAADIDVFILDKSSYMKYAELGAFVNLDEIAGDLGVDKEKNKELILKIREGEEDEKEEEEEHLYGIDVSSSPIFTKAEIAGGEKIAAIGVKVKHYEHALKFLKFLIESL